MKWIIKKILSILLTVTFVFGSIALGFSNTNFSMLMIKAKAETSGTCGNDVTWSFDTSTLQLKISGTGDMYDYLYEELPWSEYCSTMKVVTITNGVTCVGNAAFSECPRLAIVIIEDSVTSIGEEAFSDCSGLENVIIGNGVTDIGRAAFYNCTSLKMLHIPDGAINIGDDAFKNCQKLSSIVIPNSVTSIGESVFLGCTGLTSIELSASTTSIGNSAFSGCTGLTSITIPNSVTSIGNYAFSRCTALSYMEIPDSVTGIGDFAFSRCTSLCYIDISDSVTSIGNSAFSGCTGLTSITIPDSVVSIGNGVFSNCQNLENIIIGNGVTSINDKMFYGFSKLTTVIIGNGVTNIGNEAFYNCNTLTSVTIGNGLTRIGDSAFEMCSSLTNIKIPDDVIYIGNSAFEKCENLTSITIPSNVTSIGDCAFNACDSLANIMVDPMNTAYSSDEYGVLFSKDKSELIQYPIGNTRTNYVISNNTTTINDYAFAGCENLTTVSLPDDLTRINYSSFRDCIVLTSIEIPDSVRNIGDYAFDGCHNLTNIVLSENLNSISWSSFYNTGYYRNISNWENDILYLDDYLIFANESITGFYSVKEGTKGVAAGAFRFCEELTSIAIPDSVTYIGGLGNASLTRIRVSSENKVYSNDDYGVLFNKDKTELIRFPAGLKRSNYTIPDTVTNIGGSAFSDCSSLASIKIPDSVTYIGDYAFSYCTSLVSIIIPDGVTSIGNYTFNFCQALTSIIIPDNVISIGSHAFAYCRKLNDITIPNKVKSIGIMSFYFCDLLSNVYYTGVEKEWKNINVDDFNDDLLTATIHYNYLNSHIHNYISTVTKEPSCLEVGVMTYTCICDDSYTEAISKKSHINGDWKIITESTCVTQGKKIKKCVVCGTVISTLKLPFALHQDLNKDGLCDFCDKISNVELVKDIYISIATPESRTINYMESIKLYATTVNLPEGYKIKWKVEGEGVSIKPSTNGKTCTAISTSTGDVVIKVYIVDLNGNIVTDKNGKQICDSEYFYSDANLWLRIVYFFKKLFGISIPTVQAFKGII